MRLVRCTSGEGAAPLISRPDDLSNPSQTKLNPAGWYVPIYDNQGYREWGKCGGCDLVKKPCASADASGKFFCPSEGTGSIRKCTNYRSPTQCKTDNFLATGCNLWRADGYYTARSGVERSPWRPICILLPMQ